jgi:hypothetical protein
LQLAPKLKVLRKRFTLDELATRVQAMFKMTSTPEQLVVYVIAFDGEF